MKLDITREEALSLLLSAASLQAPQFAVLCYASDRTQFIQALYRARKGDPLLESIQIRQINDGIALLNPNFNSEEWKNAAQYVPTEEIVEGDDNDEEIS